VKSIAGPKNSSWADIEHVFLLLKSLNFGYSDLAPRELQLQDNLLVGLPKSLGNVVKLEQLAVASHETGDL
jgi:hypothetical protein